MNQIAVVPKEIEIQPSLKATVSALSWRSTDDAFNRRLSVLAVGVGTFTVSGDDYDALGQWTDDTIRDLILARYGLELA
jgi:hypothetical protein